MGEQYREIGFHLIKMQVTQYYIYRFGCDFHYFVSRKTERSDRIILRKYHKNSENFNLRFETRILSN